MVELFIYRYLMFYNSKSRQFRSFLPDFFDFYFWKLVKSRPGGRDIFCRQKIFSTSKNKAKLKNPAWWHPSIDHKDHFPAFLDIFLWPSDEIELKIKKIEKPCLWSRDFEKKIFSQQPDYIFSIFFVRIPS